VQVKLCYGMRTSLGDHCSPLLHLRTAPISLAYLPGARCVAATRVKESRCVYSHGLQPGHVRFRQVTADASRKPDVGLLIVIQLVSP